MLKRLLLIACYWTVIHTNSTCKYVFAYLLFRHCLIVEGYNYFYIVSLILCFVFISVVCLILQELFEGWDYIELHQIKKYLPVFIESKDGDSHNA